MTAAGKLASNRVNPAPQKLRLAPQKLRPSDLARVASVGLRTRRMRAGLSALGIAIGVAAIVAVLGLSSSSQAGLLSEIERLGTNLLIVTNGQSFAGKTAELPLVAPAMIARVDPVETVAETGKVNGSVYRSPLIPDRRNQCAGNPGGEPRPAAHAGHRCRAGSLPERRHRAGASRGARLRGRATTRDRPHLPR